MGVSRVAGVSLDKARLETFTDGVFAIVVTLLVLDIHLPAGTTASTLGRGLGHVLPALGTYALSVVIVGLYWVSHHLAAQQFKAVDTRVMWLNIVFILFTGLVPFSTRVLGEFPFTRWAIVTYGANVLVMNLAGWLMIRYLHTHPDLAEESFTPAAFSLQSRQYGKVAILYGIGVVLGFVTPDASVFVYAAVTVYVVLSTVFPRLSWRSRVASG